MTIHIVPPLLYPFSSNEFIHYCFVYQAINQERKNKKRRISIVKGKRMTNLLPRCKRESQRCAEADSKFKVDWFFCFAPKTTQIFLLGYAMCIKLKKRKVTLSSLLSSISHPEVEFTKSVMCISSSETCWLT